MMTQKMRLESLFSDRPRQQLAWQSGEFLKAYAGKNEYVEEGKTAFETWCTVDIDDMISQIRIDMDDLDAEFDEERKNGGLTQHDIACQCHRYLIMWFILKELTGLKDEHGWYKYCADMVEPGYYIDLDDGGKEKET